jgi:hypothetical protein
MAIDDPIDAILTLNASDERQRSPVSRFAVDFLRVVKMFAPKGTEIPIAALEGAVDWLGRQRVEHREDLLKTVVDEMKYRGEQIDQLIANSGVHAQFMADEMPALALEALRRAEQTRARARIRRLGKILVHAAEVGPQDGADYAEEMMRIAMDLNDRDVSVLKELYAAQGDLTTSGVVQREQVNEAWRDRPPRIEGMGENEIQSICAKLQSFGLVTRIERNDFKLGPAEIPHALLQKGADFITYIASRNQQPDGGL